jgi:hypothetical protein
MRSSSMTGSEQLAEERADRIRRRVRVASIITLVLVAAAPACIFDQGSYQGGGREGQGAGTAATGSDSTTASAPDTSQPTSTSTSTSTSTASVDAGVDGG